MAKASNDKVSDYTLLELLDDIRSWNNSDIRNYDQISPNLPMFKARRSVINEVIKKAKD